jgi:mannose-1-phosphate guanylyltransferase
MIDSHDCLVKLPENRVAVIQGMDNKIVVEADNKLLILDKNDEQNLKKYLETISKRIPGEF